MAVNRRTRPSSAGVAIQSSTSPLLITVGVALGALTLASAIYWIANSRESVPSATSTRRNPSNTTRNSASTDTSRKSRSKSRRLVTISAKNIIFWNPSKDPEHPNYAFLEGAIPTLSSILQSDHYDIHIIIVVESDLEVSQITNLMNSSGLAAAGLDSRRVLFCATEEGKSHIIRHIEPAIHIDSNDDVISRLAPFVNRIVRVRQSKVYTATTSNASCGLNTEKLRRPGGDGLVRSESVRSLAIPSTSKTNISSTSSSTDKADILKSLPPHHAETELAGQALHELLRRGNVAIADSLDQAGLV
ncbi:hypothetical protein SeMB42_g00418 [Synchytrium endobioticum]|uniref:Peroxisome assembly protein 22 n=1 Tax=Synchytrium endobioticum TaxID=286115 RepID=A0A507D833_9FUNG|nr:hypothetical protein SeLEV6574_g02569 [Synchytrium endobioticum]TPX54196.1 hypothetical protein SeMB42_g00418 [Synchytrium endobioticum]